MGYFAPAQQLVSTVFISSARPPFPPDDSLVPFFRFNFQFCQNRSDYIFDFELHFFFEIFFFSFVCDDVVAVVSCDCRTISEEANRELKGIEIKR